MELFVLLILVVLSAAQDPKPCKTPPIFEGFFMDFFPGINEFMPSRLSVDSTKHLMYMHEDRIFASSTSSFDFIMIYEEGIQYVFNTQFRNCSRQKLAVTWEDYYSVPTGATFVTKNSIGNNTLQVQTWVGNETSGEAYTGAWSDGTCIPIRRTYGGPRSGMGYVTYYNITVGIADPNIFVPPSYCPTSGAQNVKPFLALLLSIAISLQLQPTLQDC